MQINITFKNIIMLIILISSVSINIIVLLMSVNTKVEMNNYILDEIDKRFKLRDSIFRVIDNLETEAYEESERVKTLDNDSTVKLFNELIKSK